MCGTGAVFCCSHEQLIGEVLVRYDGFFVLDVLYDHLLDVDARVLNHWLLSLLLLLSMDDQVFKT